MAISKTPAPTGFNGSQPNQFGPSQPFTQPDSQAWRGNNESVPSPSYGTRNVGDTNYTLKDPGAGWAYRAMERFNYATTPELRRADPLFSYYQTQAADARGAAAGGMGGGGGGTSKLGGGFNAQADATKQAMEAYGKYMSDYSNKILGGFKSYKDFLTGIIGKYGIAPKVVTQANTGLSNLLKGSTNIDADPVYKEAMSAQENALTRQLIAQGHNPAESGFGANVLAESSSRLRLDALNNMIKNYAGILGEGNDLAKIGLNSIGGLMQGQTNFLSSNASALGGMLQNLVKGLNGSDKEDTMTLNNIANLIS